VTSAEETSSKPTTGLWRRSRERNSASVVGARRLVCALAPNTSAACPHKLFDDFMARTLVMRGAAPVAEKDDEKLESRAVIPVPTAPSLTSAVAHPPPERIVAPVPATYVDGYIRRRASSSRSLSLQATNQKHPFRRARRSLEARERARRAKRPSSRSHCRSITWEGKPGGFHIRTGIYP
jgi:hypothetical protein